MLNVFYDPRMAVDSKGFSPSAAKPAAVVQDWLSRKSDIEIRTVVPATRMQLATAHSRRYVAGVFSGRIPNGHGNSCPQVAESTLWTVGSMVTACRYVLENGGVACSPTSGFHHARHDDGGGFCTFNGLMVAAVDALWNGGVDRVGIFDCDWHYGNGTDDIIDKLGYHNKVMHYTMGVQCGVPTVDGYLYSFERELRAMVYGGCKLLIYQAGADPHKNDPLGGIFSDKDLAVRDKMVFEAVKEAGIPCVWNLAGGYQKEADGSIPKVLAIHRKTMQVCNRVSKSSSRC